VVDTVGDVVDVVVAGAVVTVLVVVVVELGADVLLVVVEAGACVGEVWVLSNPTTRFPAVTRTKFPLITGVGKCWLPSRSNRCWATTAPVLASRP
jgi:hypothetical protein